MALGLAEWINLAAAVALTALGTFLLVRRGRNKVTVSMAAFVLGLAGLYVGRVAVSQTGPTDAYVLVLLPYAAAIAGMLGLTWSIGGRFDAKRSRGAVAAAIVLAVTFQAIQYTRGLLDLATFRSEAAAQLFSDLQFVLNMGYYLSGLLLPVRALTPATPPETSRALALVAVGLSLFGAGTAATWIDTSLPTYVSLSSLVACAALGLAWLRPGRHPKARLGMVTGIVILAVWAASGIAESAWPGSAYPVGRVLGTLLMLYAVLHGEIAGIDAKVRFTVSKGTVAGIVVAVVFIASEGAQSLFGEDKQWLGLVLGGFVVFAIAPLQRAADRLAEKAVPSGKAIADDPGAHALYRKQASLVWADGKVTAKEIRLLKQLRDELRLPTEEAERIDEEVAPR